MQQKGNFFVKSFRKASEVSLGRATTTTTTNDEKKFLQFLLNLKCMPLNFNRWMNEWISKNITNYSLNARNRACGIENWRIFRVLCVQSEARGEEEIKRKSREFKSWRRNKKKKLHNKSIENRERKQIN